MWPFSSSVPPIKHESCARRLAELTERIEQLELASGERHLQVLDIAEKVAERLTERVRKRVAKEGEPGANPYDVVRARRAMHGVP